jgi:hypothetical protein
MIIPMKNTALLRMYILIMYNLLMVPLLAHQLHHQIRQICHCVKLDIYKIIFTEQETEYLLNDNTCVVDNLVGLYGKELKLNRDKMIKLNKEFHGFVDVEEDDKPEFIESDLGDFIVNPN